MNQSALSQAVRKFFKTTSLHGFKYVYSEYCLDRVGWVGSCCASACCAGVLCCVLWARFLNVPALLAMQDLRADIPLAYRMPQVAVCPTPEWVAESFLRRLKTNESNTQRLPLTLSRLMSGKRVAEDQLDLLDEILALNNETLPEAMLYNMPQCAEMTRKCRWQKSMIPCGQLFEKELTYWGVCCMLRPEKLLKVSTSISAQFDTASLDLALQCSTTTTLHDCAFLTKYEGEEWVEPDLIKPGYNYIGQLRFSSIQDSHDEALLDGTCVSENNYSRRRCLVNCAEASCGCSEPMVSDVDIRWTSALPPCSVRGLSCVRAYGFQNKVSCNCLPACRKVTTYTTLEMSPINVIINYTHDPIYTGLNVTSSTFVYLRVNLALSRIFYLNPTETWLTLLSSLGGIFNMFLGVGLFSALELLFLLFVKLPIAIRRSSDRVHRGAQMH